MLIRPRVLLVAIVANPMFGGLAETSVAAESATIWILSGQSNACGRAALPGPDPDPRVTMYVPRQASYITAQDPLPHMGTTGTGPWVAAAATVVASQGDPIRMCGFASGGKPISFWDVGQPGHDGLFPVVRQAGQGASVFLWYQGESDTRRLQPATYEGALRSHVDRVREAAGNDQLLVVIVQLGPSLREGVGGYMAVREAQRRFVANDAHAILVPALGRTLMDTVHLDNAGYRELGAEIGRALLATRHRNQDVGWPGPVLDAAVILPPQERGEQRLVAAHFAEVQRLKNVNPLDFSVIDTEGTNPCVGVTAQGQTLLTLRLQRDVRLPAKLVYGFGARPTAELTDEHGNRAPAVQRQITTGVAPADEATKAANGAGER